MTNLFTRISKAITFIVILVIGILCIVANFADDAAAYESISVVMGVTFIVVASLVLVFEIIALLLSKGGNFLTSGVISSGLMLAAGIFFCADKTVGGGLIALFLNYVPYAMIVVGSLVAFDAVVNLVFGLTKKENTKTLVIVTIVKLVVATIAIVLGILALGNNWLGDNKFLIFGIIVCVYATLGLLLVLFAPTVLVKVNVEGDK